MKLANSEARTYKECRRKWWLTYFVRLRRRLDGPGPLSLGNMVHYVLERVYALEPAARQDYIDNGTWLDDLAAYTQTRVAELEASAYGAHHVPGTLAEMELARLMLEGYFEWLSEEGRDSEIEVLAPEQEVEAYLDTIEGEEVWMIAKLDVIARMRGTGDNVFVDHKTVANLTDLPKTAHLDEQQRWYGLIQRMAQAQAGVEAPRAIGGLFNMLRKVKRTKQANPPFYGRHAVRHNDETYRTFQRRVWGVARDIILTRRALEAGADHHVVAYPNPTRDCSWKCPFFSVCGQFDDGSDVAAVVDELFEEHDPLARYTELEKS